MVYGKWSRDFRTPLAREMYYTLEGSKLKAQTQNTFEIGAKDYIADLDEFERKCREEGILEGNVIWGISVDDFPDLEPEACGSMAYVGKVEC